MAGSQLDLEHRVVPGTARQRQVSPGRGEENPVRPYSERLRTGNSARDDCHHGEQSAGGWQRADPGSAATVPGRGRAHHEGMNHHPESPRHLRQTGRGKDAT